MTELNQPPPAPTALLSPGQQLLKCHRGGIILTLGILGIVLCFICGIIAWVMGKNDIRQMDAGTMDPAGRDLTQAGKICGIIGFVMGCISVGGVILWILFALGVAIFAAIVS